MARKKNDAVTGKKAKSKKENLPPPAEKKPDRRGPKLRGPTEQADFDNFEALLKMQCTLEEVAAFFDCDVKTIQARVEEHYGMKFSQVSSIKRDAGKISLRRAQWNKAIGGNIPMLIWLGKQYLAQSERIQEVSRGDPLEGLTLEKLQTEIQSRESRLAGIRLKGRSAEDFEKKIIEEAKKPK